jgi:hypothetical protein
MGRKTSSSLKWSIAKVLECIKLRALTNQYNSRKYNFEAPGKKYLYVSPVGENGKIFLAKIIKRFGNEHFDYLIFNFDNATFNETIYSNCRVIHEKGFKWNFAVKYLTADYCRQYDFLFIWDDDIDIDDFMYTNFIEIMDRNNLEIAQPALSHKSYYSHAITLHDKRYRIGRYTDFVEVMAPVFRNDAWLKFRNMVSENDNPWGWGYDLLAKSYCRYANMGIVDCETVTHTRPLRSIYTDARNDMQVFFKKYPGYRHAQHISYAKLR